MYMGTKVFCKNFSVLRDNLCPAQGAKMGRLHREPIPYRTVTH